MKKSLFPRLALMAVVVALVSACSEKKFEYTNVIPANASTVVSINMKSLVDKAGLNDKENKEAQQKLTDAMKSGMKCRNIPTSGNDYERSEEIGNRRIGTFICFQY